MRGYPPASLRDNLFGSLETPYLPRTGFSLSLLAFEFRGQLFQQCFPPGLEHFRSEAAIEKRALMRQDKVSPASVGQQFNRHLGCEDALSTQVHGRDGHDPLVRLDLLESCLVVDRHARDRRAFLEQVAEGLHSADAEIRCELFHLVTVSFAVPAAGFCGVRESGEYGPQGAWEDALQHGLGVNDVWVVPGGNSLSFSCHN